MGQLVEVQQLQTGAIRLEWNTSTIEAGTYWLRVDGEEIDVQTKRIVVTR
jgi:hypothetical protein